jgi:hypothetical protein
MVSTSGIGEINCGVIASQQNAGASRYIGFAFLVLRHTTSNGNGTATSAYISKSMEPTRQRYQRMHAGMSTIP